MNLNLEKARRERKVQYNFQLSDSLRRRIIDYSDKNNLSASAFSRALFEQFFENIDNGIDYEDKCKELVILNKELNTRLSILVQKNNELESPDRECVSCGNTKNELNDVKNSFRELEQLYNELSNSFNNISNQLKEVQDENERLKKEVAPQNHWREKCKTIAGECVELRKGKKILEEQLDILEEQLKTLSDLV